MLLLIVLAIGFMALMDNDTTQKRMDKMDADPESTVHTNKWHKAHPNG